MVVYADVLIVLNLIVDYFLLRASAKISGVTPGVWRMLGGAAVGAVSSLYIFLPQSGIMLELLFRIAVCLVMTACTFGFRTLHTVCRNLRLCRNDDSSLVCFQAKRYDNKQFGCIF